jgi:hypothetical protein
VLATAQFAAYLVDDINIKGFNMKHSIDYMAVWNDAMALLRTHQEAVLALAGILLFLPSWIAQFFCGSPDIVNGMSMQQMVTAQQEYLIANWTILLPTGIVSLFGMATIYVILIRKDLSKIGDALPLALSFMVAYFVLQIATGMVIAASLLVLVIPGLYVLARFWLATAILPDPANRGILAALKRSWNLTRGAGWKAVGLAVIIMIVAFACYIVVLIIVGSVLKLLTGGAGLPFVETAFSALMGTVINIVIYAVTVALLRHLEAQQPRA